MDDQTDLKRSLLYRKALGSLLGGLIGDAVGTPTEGKDYAEIEQRFGWVADFDTDGTDDTVMKNLLAEALVHTEGYATADDWAQVWLDHWADIFGEKYGKFFISVVNSAQKLRCGYLPRMASLGNLPSSSSAMCISPVGIVNACNPAQAARQAYDVASLIHTYDAAFCQDGAAAMAAAVAEAMSPKATAASVLRAASAAIVPQSGREMLERIHRACELAAKKGEYKAFRAAVYAEGERFFCRITCDSRETVPLTLALFQLAEGDVEKSITYSANFGRDTDTIASMAGAIAGALRSVEGIRSDWVAKAQQVTRVSQEELASQLVQAAVSKLRREQEILSLLAGIILA